MPEGDAVWLICRRLHVALAGKPLVRSEFRVPSLATVDLTTKIVSEAVSRGKHLLIRTTDGLTVHSHLRMDGNWRVYDDNQRWTGGRPYEIRAILGVAGTSAVGYRLPVLELLRTDREDAVLGYLGPDLLGDDWDTDDAVRRLTSDPTRPIGEALLDQRNLAGIGTIYRAEVLFLQGIHPRTEVGKITNLRRVCERVRQLMMNNITGRIQTMTGDRRRGRTEWVYGRANQPCRRCGTKIQTEEFGPEGMERPSYWCPHCQPLR
jgi:endonuclease-8